MIIDELVSKLGLDVDSASFVQGLAFLKGLNGALDVIANAAIAAGKAMLDLIPSTAQLGFDVAKTAQETGMTTDALQELQFAAGESGVGADTLRMGLQRLATTAFDAAHGSTEARFAMAQLGARATDASGKLRPVNDVLADVADHFSKLNEADKVPLARKVFGKGGAALIPLLEQGSKGLDDLRIKAHEYGVVLDADVIGNSREYVIAQYEMNAALQGLKNEIGGPLLRGASKFALAVAKWVSEHRKAIATPIIAFVEKLKSAFVSIASVIGGAVRSFQDLEFWILLAGAALLFFQGRAIATALLMGLIDAVMLIPWILLGAAILLAADALWGFYTGQDSLLGMLAEKWGHFYDGILKPKTGEFFLLRWLKEALAALADLESTIDRISISLGGKKLRDLFGGPGAVPIGTSIVPLAQQISAPTFSGSAPGSAADRKFNAQSAPGSIADRKFNAQINVNVPAGADANGVGVAVRQHLDDWWQSIADPAYVAVDTGNGQ